MNKTLSKTIAVCLSAALIAGGVSAAVFGADSHTASDTEAVQTVSETDDSNESETTLSKDETVYVIAGADGSVQKIIVSDWIKNSLGSASINDNSQLTDIENVKGDESYTIGSGSAKVWDAQGGDIYYQGNIEKELPVNLSVTYTLDGKTVSPSELAGKSGKVSIRFDYTNNQYETVEIDGKEEKIYVPFAMLTGILLNNDVFTNVEVSNGKLINDGNHTAIIGIAFPGLQENLAIDAEEFEIPDYVEITADVQNFELGMTVTLATNEIFNKIDTDCLDSADELKDSLNELSDAMNQLTDGSSELYGGLCTLLEKSEELTEGIDQLAAGAKELKDGADSLDSGAKELKNGAAELAAGLETLSSNNDSLNEGAAQVFETLLSTARSQLIAAGLTVPEMTIDNYADVLNKVIVSLDETTVYNTAYEKVVAAVEANRSLIQSKVTEAVKEQVTVQVTAAVKEQVTAQVTAAVKEQVAAQVTAAVRDSVAEKVIPAATGMSKSDYEAALSAGQVSESVRQAVDSAIDTQMESADIQETIQSSTDSQMKSAEMQKTIQSNTDAQMKSETVKKTIEDNVAAQMKSDTVKELIAENTEFQVKQAIAENMASDTVQSQLAAASEGAKSVISLKASLDSYNAFYLGLLTYTAGVETAADGAEALKAGTETLKEGTSQLSEGADALYDGILTLKDGVPALVEGVTQLRDGAMTLSDGLTQFNEEGIQKLVDAVNGNIDVLVTRIRATVDVSKNYKSFSGISEDMDGQVKFIYRTESVKAEGSTETEE